MVGGSQHVDVRQVVGDRERTDQLGGVDEDDRPDGTGDRADGDDVGAMPGRALDTAERDHPGGLVDQVRDVVGLEAPVAEGHLAHVVPLVDELAPGEVVGAVLPLADDDVLARRGRTELGADETRHRRERGDQGHVRRLGADQPGDGGPGGVGGPFALGEVEPLRAPAVDRAVVGLGERAAGQAHRRRVQVRPVGGGREELPGLAEVHWGHRFTVVRTARKSTRGEGSTGLVDPVSKYGPPVRFG